MPIIIQEASVQMVSPQDKPPAEASSAAAQSARSSVVPLRPADVEQMQRYLNARRARLRAD
jgi:hypothetical protein